MSTSISFQCRHPFIKDICLSTLLVVMFSRAVFLLRLRCFLKCIVCVVLMSFVIVNFFIFDNCLILPTRVV
jgi:hypothetical protein